MMVANYKKGAAVWIFGFLTILSFSNVFNSVVMWLQNGGDYLFTPYLIDPFISTIPVKLYFWISVAIGFVFLGCASFTAFRTETEIIKTIKAQKRTQEELLGAYRTILKSHEHLEVHVKNASLRSQEQVEASVENVGVELSAALSKQNTVVKSVGQLSNALDKHMHNVGVELSAALSKQNTVVKSVGRLNKTIEKVNKDLADVKKGFQSLEDALLFPDPKITAESSTMEINGIGPTITKELEAMGIKNAGEFLFTDPSIIAESTHLSRDQAEYLQGMVQLLMIPGIDETKVDLFVNAGVTNRKELAVQDPFELNVKLGKVYVTNEKYLKYKKPTFGEVLSWVRTAKM